MSLFEKILVNYEMWFNYLKKKKSHWEIKL